MKGSKYRKTDLHIHSPASRCFEDPAVTADQIVEAAVGQRLEVIAITDHNTADFIDDVRQAAKGKPILVFPGIEITAANAHILAIFERDCPVQRLNDLLARVNILADMRGKQDAIGDDAEKVVREIHLLGGIAIAAHANSNNGLLKHPQGQYRLKVCSLPELAALEFTSDEDVRKFISGAVPRYPRKACVQNSDAHNLAQIGQRFTHLKMDYVSLEGIRQALLDHEVKTRFAWHTIPQVSPRIASLSVSQGFFDGILFEFHPHLNCLVGGKGTGKSTAIELMRYAFNVLPEFEDLQDDTLGKALALVGPGGVISITCVDESGEEFVIERSVTEDHDTEAICRDKNGQACLLPFRPIFFSQGELARVAISQLAQMNLIDSYVDLHEENAQEETLIGDLRKNAAEILQAEENIATLLFQVNDPISGKKLVEAEVKRLGQALKEPILTEFPRWEAEGRFIADRLAGLRAVPNLVKDALEGVDLDELFGIELPAGAPNAASLKSLEDLPQQITTVLEAFGKRLSEELGRLERELERTTRPWESRYNEKKKEYEAFVAKVKEKTLATLQARYRNATKRLEGLEKAEKDAKAWQDWLLHLRGVRRQALESLRNCRLTRCEKRREKARQWEQALRERIKIEIIVLGDRRQYASQLREALRGSWIQEKDQKLVVRSLEPEVLAKGVRDRDINGITVAGIGVDPATKIVDFLSQKPAALFELEAVELPDLPQICFEVAPGVHKPLNALSVGQKGTVVISLGMVEGSAPLIIDQPEDSLDTLFIYEQIVKKLREQKESRQFIFATHNANLLVTADADLSFVMEASADKGEVRSQGGIDRKDTRDLLLVHLEGGETAFKIRAMKYGK